MLLNLEGKINQSRKTFYAAQWPRKQLCQAIHHPMSSLPKSRLRLNLLVNIRNIIVIIIDHIIPFGRNKV